MFDAGLFSVVFLGLVVGIFHAFDADHVVAMATLANQKSKKRQVLKYALKWGGGHGGVLLVLGFVLAFIGLELPSWFVHYSEIMVGVLLMYLGVRLWLFLQKKKNALNGELSTKDTTHDHAPLFIGMLHGVAGSAPVLALLPNMLESEFLLHIFLFSTGCLIGMFCFGVALGSAQVYMKKFENNTADYFARIVSIISITLGAYWVFN